MTTIDVSVSDVASVPRRLIPQSLVLSPDARRVAWSARNSEEWSAGQTVAVDGREDGQVWAGVLGGYPVFSPDSASMAYKAQRDDKQKVVVRDGTLEGVFSELVGALSWGLGGRHLAYIAGNGSEQWIVRDGVADPSATEVLTQPVFSPDGGSLAYGVRAGGRCFITLNGAVLRDHDEIWQRVVFAHDGTRLAYPCTDRGRWHVWFGNEAGPAFDAVLGTSLTSAPQRALVAYGAKRSGKVVLVKGTAELGSYDSLLNGFPEFSPDGQRCAFGVVRDGRCLIVLDGLESREYESIGRSAFSPDGRHYAFAAQSAGKWFLVQDGIESRPYDEVLSPVFSPDSRHVAFIACRGQQQAVVHDGEEQEWCNEVICGPFFSPEGQRLIHAAMRESKPFVIAGSHVVELPSRVISDLVFDGDGRFHALLGQRDYEVRRRLTSGVTERFCQGLIRLAEFQLR